jgi:hypothetical protein
MRRNIGTTERVARGLGAAGMIVCAFMAPMAAELRLPLFGGLGAALLFTALSGTCPGYWLLGKRSCESRSA